MPISVFQANQIFQEEDEAASRGMGSLGGSDTMDDKILDETPENIADCPVYQDGYKDGRAMINKNYYDPDSEEFSKYEKGFAAARSDRARIGQIMIDNT